MRAYLIKNGIPFDVAWTLDEQEATAYAIIFGQIEGGVWEWSTMSWKKND